MSDNVNEVQNLSGEKDSPEQKQPKKKKAKKPHHLLRRIICFFLGFIFGILSVIGAVAGGAYYVATQPIKGTVETVDSLTSAGLYATLFGSTDANGNVTPGLLHEKYAEATIGEFIGDVSDAIGGLSSQNASLKNLNELSPKVEETVGKLVDTLAGYGFQMDTQELLSTPFKGDNGLVSYVKESMLNASAGDLFTGFSGESLSPLLATICYGEEGVDYVKDAEGNITMLGTATKTTVKDLISEDLSAVFDKITVDSVIEITPDNAIMCSLAYGPANRYQFNGDKVTMLQVLYTISEEDGKIVLFDDADEKVKGTVETIATNFYKLTTADGVSYVKDGKAYADEACQTPVLYQKAKLGDLQGDTMEIVDGILLKDALDLTPASSQVLLSLAGYKVANGQLVENGKARTIGDLRKQGEDVFNDICLSDVMPLENSYQSKITMRFLYGKEGVHYDLKMENGKPVVTMKEQTIYVLKSDNSKVYDEEGKLIPGGSADETAKIYTDPDGTQHPYLLKGSTSLVTGEKVYVRQLADENGNPLYYQPTTIGDFKGDKNIISTLVNTLTLGEVFEDDVFDNHIFLKHVKNETIETLPDAIEKLTVVEVYDEEVHNPDGTLKGSWKYLLTDKDTGEVDTTITVVDMQKMIDNMQANIHHATLYELKADGVLENLEKDMLNKEIKRSIKHPVTGVTVPLVENLSASKHYLGDLTVDEMLAYVSKIIMYLP